MGKPFKVGDVVVAVDETHGWGHIKHGAVGKVSVVHSGGRSLDVDFEKQAGWTGDLKCFKHWEDKEGIDMAKQKFKVGDKIRRINPTHQGSNGTSVMGKEYVVLTASSDDRCVGIFIEKGGGHESPCWIADNFELVEEAEDIPMDWDDVVDTEFGQLQPHQKKMAVKGYNWFCAGCRAASRKKLSALNCCSKEEVLFVDTPDYLWYSATKDELVHVQDMLNPHLKAAITKLRKEKERNPMHHLLPVLENEAYLRDMDI